MTTDEQHKCKNCSQCKHYGRDFCDLIPDSHDSIEQFEELKQGRNKDN